MALSLKIKEKEKIYDAQFLPSYEGAKSRSENVCKKLYTIFKYGCI